MQHQQKLGNFIAKLQYLLNRQQYCQIICWDKTKTMIDVISQEKMQTQIIPLYFRHQKYQSFVRQLNLYGFKKIKCNGKHRFTHSKLLNGEKLQSITTHKSNKIGKKNHKEELFESSSQKGIDPDGSLENELGYIKSQNQFKNQSAKTATISEQNKPQGGQTSPPQQLLSGYINPYLNYWNMFSMEHGSQFPGIFFVSPMPTYQ